MSYGTPGGVLNFIFGYGCAASQIEMDPSIYHFLKTNGPMYLPLSPNFLPIWKMFTKNSPELVKLAQIIAHFWKVDPYVYQIWLRKRGHWFTRGAKRGPMFAAHPCNLFSTENAPRVLPYTVI
jgi:hypothetical protein